jgi:hypothetical protein
MAKTTPSAFLCHSCNIMLMQRGYLNPETDLCKLCKSMLNEAHRQIVTKENLVEVINVKTLS